MKEGIHPKYFDVVATCVCGNEVQLGSTQKAIRVEICSACHPFYTGQQKIVDTEGRVERFVKRYGKKINQEEAEKEEEAKANAS